VRRWLVQNGVAELPNLKITDSSEALLGGKQPNLYLCAVALNEDGTLSNIEPVVSPPFVVRCMLLLSGCMLSSCMLSGCMLSGYNNMLHVVTMLQFWYL
jgi:hypothetical protein